MFRAFVLRRMVFGKFDGGRRMRRAPRVDHEVAGNAKDPRGERNTMCAVPGQRLNHLHKYLLKQVLGRVHIRNLIAQEAPKARGKRFV